jgi:hypothetical protein
MSKQYRTIKQTPKRTNERTAYGADDFARVDELERARCRDVIVQPEQRIELIDQPRCARPIIAVLPSFRLANAVARWESKRTGTAQTGTGATDVVQRDCGGCHRRWLCTRAQAKSEMSSDVCWRKAKMQNRVYVLVAMHFR